MLAARLEDGDLRITDVPDPEAAAGEVLVHMHAAGVCHSDLHLARGDWAGIPSVGPLGHEGIGVVEAVGPGAERFVAVGDRVILGLGGVGGAYWCGACRECLAGHPRLCAQSQVLMGTFAEYLSVWAPAVVKLPAILGDEEAPLACGGLTAYSAVKKLVQHGIMPGRPIAVVGAAGGLGHYAVQLASAFGYEVVGIDVGDDRLDFVRSLGATRAYDARDALGAVHADLGGVDASLVFAARIAGYELGLQLLGPRGLMVCVGIPATSDGNIQLNPLAFLFSGVTIVPSVVGTVADMQELVHLAETGKVSSHVSRTGSLSDLPAIFEELEAAKYLGRAVLTDLAR